MVCRKCGKQMQDDKSARQYSLCRDCASEITIICPECNKAVPLPDFLQEMTLCADCFRRIYGSLSKLRGKNMVELIKIGALGTINILLFIMVFLSVFDL
jgi:hypothetical protein